MQDLVLTGMSWCFHHGCPVVSLRPMEGDEQFWVTFSADEAEAMAAAPIGGSRGARRIFQILEAVTSWLDASVSEVRIGHDEAGMLTATVKVEQPSRGSLLLPVSTTEGIVLAWRNQCPIRIDDHTLARIQRSLEPVRPFRSPETSGQPDPDDLDPAVVDFIQSLDLDWSDDGGSS